MYCEPEPDKNKTKIELELRNAKGFQLHVEPFSIIPHDNPVNMVNN